VLFSFELRVHSSPINSIFSEKGINASKILNFQGLSDELNIIDTVGSSYEYIDNDTNAELKYTKIFTDPVNVNKEISDLPCNDIQSCIDWMKEKKEVLNEFGFSNISDEIFDYLLLQYQDKTNIEKLQQNFESVNYGIKVDVNGNKMSVNIKGEEHNTTIVVLPGLGISSPVLFYKSLTEILSNDYKVVTIEPFGYGVSDLTDEERTAENMVFEIHECLQKLGIDQFYLMAHSIGGIYSIIYDNTFENEVLGFIGLDNTPSNYDDYSDDSIPEVIYTFAKIFNKYHLWGLFPENQRKEIMDIEHEQQYQNYSEEELEDLLNINSYRFSNPNLIDESSRSGDNVASTKGLYFHCPLLMFTSEQTQSFFREWNTLHENMINDNPNKKIIDKSKVIPLEGTTHGFIHTQKKDIIYDEINRWIN